MNSAFLSRSSSLVRLAKGGSRSSNRAAVSLLCVVLGRAGLPLAEYKVRERLWASIRWNHQGLNSSKLSKTSRHPDNLGRMHISQGSSGGLKAICRTYGPRHHCQSSSPLAFFPQYEKCHGGMTTVGHSRNDAADERIAHRSGDPHRILPSELCRSWNHVRFVLSTRRWHSADTSNQTETLEAALTLANLTTLPRLLAVRPSLLRCCSRVLELLQVNQSFARESRDCFASAQH